MRIYERGLRDDLGPVRVREVSRRHFGAERSKLLGARTPPEGWESKPITPSAQLLKINFRYNDNLELMISTCSNGDFCRCDLGVGVRTPGFGVPDE